MESKSKDSLQRSIPESDEHSKITNCQECDAENKEEQNECASCISDITKRFEILEQHASDLFQRLKGIEAE